MTRFGDFSPLCQQTPSYPWCNPFFRQVRWVPFLLGHKSDQSFQLLRNAPVDLVGVSRNATSAPVGVNPQCGIPRIGTGGSIGNIANIVTCVISMFVVGALIFFTSKRKAAVGKFNLRAFASLSARSLLRDECFSHHEFFFQ
jgi:hypothetical protein